MKYLLTLLLFMHSAFAINPGDVAIDFQLVDQNGKKVKLSDYKGKFIVLEWFNAGCPYVKKQYESKNMQTIQALYKENDLVSWLTIISSAKGNQGYLSNQKEVKERIQQWGMQSDHLLRDENGNVGRAYEAKTTPHIFIIGPDFKVRYAGAIDSIASSDQNDIAKATNYITSAMNKLLLQKEPSPAKTKPYGCSVKY